MSGDALDLVAFRVGGARMRELHDAAPVREWCEGWLGPSAVSLVPQRRQPQGPAGEPDSAPAEARAQTYPPTDELQALWMGCERADVVPEVQAWCASSDLDATTLADRDLARAIPEAADLPRWASFRRESWVRTGHRLLVPLYDLQGRMRSVIARRVVEGDSPKGISPGGFARAGLLMLDGLARQVIASGGRPDWASELRLVITEGERDYLTAGLAYADSDELAPAVIGMVPGGWTQAHAGRLPPAATLILATDDDEAGDRYAQQIVRSLARRTDVRAIRWRPRGQGSQPARLRPSAPMSQEAG